ncbi:MAG: hypothetical protein FD165_515 [Gammaproteobacteria bacterium]|nr:MAG: hypothetical protein FD165_515 [Gammaproteobacteria bacterium]TND02223.1 MAG: hypothetical protein FD120_2387 [Gammaproteobacteria bacterium]
MATAPHTQRKMPGRRDPIKRRPSKRLSGKPAPQQLLDDVHELFSLCTFVGHDYHLTTAKLTGFNRRVQAPQEVMLYGCWECRRCGMTKRRSFRRRTKGA